MAKRTSTKTETAPKVDIYERLTAFIIENLETATSPTEWGWIKAAQVGAPVNVASKRAYNGINRLLLGMAVHGGASRHWGTFKQWSDLGAQVLKGSKSLPIIFWGEMHVDEDGNRVKFDAPGARKVVYGKAANVFHAGQVEGWQAPEAPTTTGQGAGQVDTVDEFIRNTGAKVTITGDQAGYIETLDLIVMPERRLFRDTAEADATTHYYGTLLHELTHWTAHKTRLDRSLESRFGSESYAMEELIAEIASAFLCADLGLSPTPRADNMAYVADWLTKLKNDKRAIFTASSAATKAATFLHAMQPAAVEIEDDQEEEPQALAA